MGISYLSEPGIGPMSVIQLTIALHGFIGLVINYLKTQWFETLSLYKFISLRFGWVVLPVLAGTTPASVVSCKSARWLSSSCLGILIRMGLGW